MYLLCSRTSLTEANLESSIVGKDGGIINLELHRVSLIHYHVRRTRCASPHRVFGVAGSGVGDVGVSERGEVLSNVEVANGAHAAWLGNLELVAVELGVLVDAVVARVGDEAAVVGEDPVLRRGRLEATTRGKSVVF